MDEVNENQKRWLVGTPANDSNFLYSIKHANKATIIAALEEVRDKPFNKAKVRALESKLRVLQKDTKAK